MVARTDRPRRGPPEADRLAVELHEDPRRRAVFEGLHHLLDVRRKHAAFDPFGTQRVEWLDDRVFAVRRGEGTDEELRCVTNVTGEAVSLPGVRGTDVLTGTPVRSPMLGPWATVWVRPG